MIVFGKMSDLPRCYFKIKHLDTKTSENKHEFETIKVSRLSEKVPGLFRG